MAKSKKGKHRVATRPGSKNAAPATPSEDTTAAGNVLPTRSLAAAIAALLVLSGLAAVLLFGTGGSSDEKSITGNGSPRVPWLDADRQDPVGGFDVNPADRSVWLASNTGLFRLAQGARRPEQVKGRLTTDSGAGEISEQLAIRFRGPNSLLASGHPPADSDLPSALGLIESSDAGKTWTNISELGKVDFHAIQLARGVLVAGLYGEAGINVSRDGGKTFQTSAPPEPIADLEVDPDRSDRWVISTATGLFTSANGGTAWRQREPVPYSRFAWPESDTLYRIDPGGPVKRSNDAGASWQNVGNTGGEPQALAAEDTDRLYAALLDGSIKASPDGGRTWSAILEP